MFLLFAGTCWINWFVFIGFINPHMLLRCFGLVSWVYFTYKHISRFSSLFCPEKLDVHDFQNFWSKLFFVRFGGRNEITSTSFLSFLSTSNCQQPQTDHILIFLSRTFYFVFPPLIYFGFISKYSCSRLLRLNITHMQSYIFLSRTLNIF